MLVFFHLEKTGGSSFREMCRSYFGQSNCQMLYGRDSKSTTKEISLFYYSNDIQSLSPNLRARKIISYFEKNNCKFFSSHFPRKFYDELPADWITVAFFRDPVSRLVSHYNHWRRAGYIDEDFQSFYRNEKMQNWYAKRMSKEDVFNLSFVGITEKFNESIDIINSSLNITLSPISINKNKFSLKNINTNKLPQSILNDIKSINYLDYELYRIANNRFNIMYKNYLLSKRDMR